MPGSSTTPGPPSARACAPVCIAFRLRNGVSTRDMRAQRLAYVLLCRRFAADLAGDSAWLEVDVDRYSFIVSDLHRLLIAGLPAHCERFCTSSGAAAIHAVVEQIIRVEAAWRRSPRMRGRDGDADHEKDWAAPPSIGENWPRTYA
jgi:hypothetical protein